MKLKTTWYDRVLTWLGFAVLLAATIYIIVAWSSLPEQLPTHYNAAGEIDSWGGKGIAFVPLVLGWIMFWVLSLIAIVPGVWNGVDGVKRERQGKALRATRDMLEILKCALAINYGYMLLCTASGRPMGGWYLPVFLTVIFAPVVITVVRIIRLNK